MKKPTYKRLLAYIIDIIIVAIIASIFIDIPLINPYFDKYIELSQSMMDYLSGVKALTEADIVKLQYDFVYYSFYSSIILISVKALYFIVFQYFNKGQTIGKALLKIKMVSEKRKLKFYQVALNALIICNIITAIINLVCLRLLSVDSYVLASNIINYVEIFIGITSVFMISIRKDGRGLHDIIAKTEVIYKEKEK